MGFMYGLVFYGVLSTFNLLPRIDNTAHRAAYLFRLSTAVYFSKFIIISYTASVNPACFIDTVDINLLLQTDGFDVAAKYFADYLKSANEIMAHHPELKDAVETVLLKNKSGILHALPQVPLTISFGYWVVV